MYYDMIKRIITWFKVIFLSCLDDIAIVIKAMYEYGGFCQYALGPWWPKIP